MITQAEVKKAAHLVKIKFTDEEIIQYAHQMGNIMNMIDELETVNTDNIEPLTSVHDAHARMRDDVATVQDLGGALFNNAPGGSASLAKEIKCFIVPKVVE